jgi:pyruvate,water dikinase
MGEDVVVFEEVDRTQVALVGGKGANLGELVRVDGVRVPDGFCVTTGAFRRAVAETPSLRGALERLAGMDADDTDAIRTLSAEIRSAVEAIPVPDGLLAEITAALEGLGGRDAYAVRSSATAEDLPTASFAGQHDSYLDVVGTAAVVDHVRRCWASLFTERAVTYRIRNGIDHRAVQMAVVVQRMVDADAAGVLFTADPVTSNRTVVVVEAVAGLGESLVSGTEQPDTYRVRDGEVVDRTIAPDRPHGPVLTDHQVVRLAELGRRIEAHFGGPQDVEWCLVGDGVHIVQSRPITTVFPVPETADGENHVYISVGHQQMMTDAMKPLGLSFWQMTTPRPMAEAGSRLFVDVAGLLAEPTSRANFLAMVERSDPLIGDALRTVVDRGDVIATRPDGEPSDHMSSAPPSSIETDPAIVDELIETARASLATLRREIRTRSGPELFDFIRSDIEELRRILFSPRSHDAVMAGMEAAWWLNDHLREWLGETNAADTLTQSVPDNVTSEMGLALLDVADVVRPHPEVVAFLEQVGGDDGFLDQLATVPGGAEARDAIASYLERYGMRCVGEIDITRTRWAERPTVLVPLILAHVRNFEPGAGARRFEQGRREAEQKGRELLEHLRALPGGEEKAEETRRMIDRVRTFAGYREHPKYGMVSRYFVYKQAMLEEARRLVRDGVLHDAEDIFYLRFDELREVVETRRVDEELLRERKAAYRAHQTLTPPRVLTSDGEVVSGSYGRDDLPAGALAGLAVSGGTVEGRARVLGTMAEATLEPGDILVTTSTDPSWTPAFVTVAGLVTEVGGLMTHGAVIAREYGLPAVVGVVGATQLIRDGQRIRVNGTDGYVELLGDASRR